MSLDFTHGGGVDNEMPDLKPPVYTHMHTYTHNTHEVIQAAV